MPPGPKPRPFRLFKKKRRMLERFARRQCAPHVQVVRARMILLLADGLGPTAVARRLSVSTRVVQKWRARWQKAPVLSSLSDAPRPGRPPTITLETRCLLVKLACDRPCDEQGVRRAVWTQDALAGALFAQTGIVISRSSVQRILSAKGLRPHRVRYWLHSPDPQFVGKVRVICDLYLHPPSDALVLSIDEKPMYVRDRRHKDHRAADASVQCDYEYVRHGVCQLLGALDIRTGRVVARVVRKRDAEALVSFLELVARTYPDRPIYVVWDNLNIHYDGPSQRWIEFNRRHGERFHFVHTPLHASWVNQIEVWFSILQRRVLRYGAFSGFADLREQVLAFIAYWNRTEAHPFRWKFSGEFVRRKVGLAA